MATSQQKSKIARLRLITNETAESFAEIIGKSLSTLRSLESGRLKLSEKTALEISNATGVSFSWLMSEKNNDPICSGANPTEVFTKEKYIHHTAKKRRPAFSEDIPNLMLYLPISDIVTAICGAAEKGNGDIALYYLEKFAEDLSKTFPAPKDKAQAARKMILLGENFMGHGVAAGDDDEEDNDALPTPQKPQPSRPRKSSGGR